jgi:hypothetical protein
MARASKAGLADSQVLKLTAERSDVLVGNELIVVAGGKRRTFLWIGEADGECLATFGGAAALRALAKAILEQVGEES